MTSHTRTPSSPARARAPVAAHPWFAAIVAIWCAALLGLSSLALAPAMLERIVASAGIDQVLPAAAPPLGQTARLALALGLAALGGVMGLALGRILAGRTRRVGAPERVIVQPKAQNGVDEPKLDVAARLAALSGRSGTLRDFDDLARLDADLDHAEVPAVDAEAFEHEEHACEPAAMAERAPEPGSPDESVDAEERAFDDSLADESPAPIEPDSPEQPHVTLPPPAPLAASAPPNSPVAAAPLEGLGIVQLTERLAVALEVRRDRGGLQAPGLAAELERGFGLLARRPQRDRAAPVMAEIHEVEPDVDPDEEEVDEGGYSSLLAITPRPPRPEVVRIDDPEGDEGEPPVSFPGLAARAAIHAGQPPADTGAAAPQPDDAELALRAALASLPRKSGAR